MNFKKIASLLLLSSTLLPNQYNASERKVNFQPIDYSELTNLLKTEPTSPSDDEAAGLDEEIPENIPEKSIESENEVEEEADELEKENRVEQNLELPLKQESPKARAGENVIEITQSYQLAEPLKTSTVTHIKILRNITLFTDEVNLKGIPVASRETPLVIEGVPNAEGKLPTINLAGGGLHIKENNQVIVKNLNFTGSEKRDKHKFSTPYFIKNSEDGTTVTFTGKITGDKGNKGLLYFGNPRATCILDNVDMDFYSRPLLASGKVRAIIRVGNLICTNESDITVDAPSFAENLAVVRGDYLIDKKTKIFFKFDSNTNYNNFVNLFSVGEDSSITIKDEGTSVISSVSTGLGLAYTEALIKLTHGALNIDNHAEVDIKNREGALVGVYSAAHGNINVKNHSTLKVTTKINTAIRFRGDRQVSFNVDNQSKLIVHSEGGDHAAIVFDSAEKHFNVTGGSDIIVEKIGDPNKSGKADNVAILYNTYDAKSHSSFAINGKDSNVSIISENGPAVLQRIDGQALKVDVGPGTYFVARGNSKGENKSIFKSSELDVLMDKPLYFDFRNDSGNLFDNSKGLFVANETNLSIWNNLESLAGNSDRSFPTMSFKANGQQFGNLLEHSIPEFTGIKDSVRITGNNQHAKVSQILPPTNADKNIYLHIVVPEGKDEIRSAYDNEGHAIILIKDKEGKEHLLQGDTLTQTRYGIEGKQTTNKEPGWIKIPVPDGEFLQAGQKIEIKKVWRGSEDISDDNVILSLDEDHKEKEKIVVDVLPPDIPKLHIGNNLVSETKEIKGKGEPGSKVLLVINDVINETNIIVSENGEFTIPVSLAVGDKVQVLLQRPAEKLIDLIRPHTNSDKGNRNPLFDFEYHDTTFKGAPVYEVKEFIEELKFEEVPTMMDFGEHEIDSNATEYWANTEGKLVIKNTYVKKSEWTVTLSQVETKENTPLTDTLTYVNGSKIIPINSEENPIITHLNGEYEDIFDISSKWRKKENGLKAVIPIEKQKVGSYSTTLKWALKNVPITK